MKKEILAGLIIIVAIASIAIFTVTPSMSTSFELDGKRTSDENFYSPHNQKIESFDPDEDTNHQVYEADLLPKFLEDLINKLIEKINEAFRINPEISPEKTNPETVGEGLYEQARGGGTEKAGEPGSPPAAKEATGEYKGERIISLTGGLDEGEIEMFKALGVREIVYNEAERLDTSTGIRYVKSSHIAFLIDHDGQYYLYYHEELDPSSNEIRSLGISSPNPSGYPRIGVSVNTNRCGVLKDEPTHIAGIDNLPENLKCKIEYAFSDDRLGLECIIKNLSPKDIEKYIEGDEIILKTKGGHARLKIKDIPVIEDVEFH
jgi:hypothetical protein